MLKSLNYQDNYNLPKGAIRISPSTIHKFNDRKWEWYQEQILGNQVFTGNTSSVLGTIVHRVAEVYIKKSSTPEELKAEIATYLSTIDNPEIDIEEIKNHYSPMGNALITHLQSFGVPEKSEEVISYEILPNIFVCGTADARLGSTLIDFKTTNTLTPRTDMLQQYKWQLLTYAWIYEKLDIDIDTIQIQWITRNNVGRISSKTGKPMKDYPSTVTAVSHLVTNDDMEFINNYLHLIAETVQKSQEDPSLNYLLFSDYRLKDTNVKSHKVFS